MGNFEKGEQAIWAKAESKYGLSIPHAFRDRFEEDWERPDFNPDNEEEVQAALSDFRCFIDEFFEKFELLQYFSSRKTKVSSSKKRYQRSFEKRLHLVRFIMGSELPIIWEEREAFALLKRFDWKQVCAKWNEAHPYDLMSSEVLKNRYYRAIAEEDIQKEYIKRRYHFIPNLDKETYIKAIEAAKEAQNENTGHGN